MFVYYAIFVFYIYHLHYVLKIRFRSLVDCPASHKIHLHSSTRAKGLMTFAIHSLVSSLCCFLKCNSTFFLLQVYGSFNDRGARGKPDLWSIWGAGCHVWPKRMNPTQGGAVLGPPAQQARVDVAASREIREWCDRTGVTTFHTMAVVYMLPLASLIYQSLFVLPDTCM